MSKRGLAINLSSNIISFFVATGISFFLSPYIVRNVGAEAYGFVSLANNFVTYIALATIALNSMAGRFITINFHQNDLEGANKYFSSVIISNIFMAGILLIPSILLVLFLNQIITVPPNLLSDVQILFAFIILNFIISFITSIFNVCYFVRNKLYVSSFINIQATVLKGLLLITLFSVFPTKIYYIGLVACIITLYSFIWNIYYTRKLLPEIKVARNNFDIKAVIKLLSSGIWNVVTKLGQLLLEGLDLLICNLYISPAVMGTLAIAKIVPNMIVFFIATLASVFSPNITISYAKKDFDEIKNILKQSIKILGAFSNVPLLILFVFGDVFYKLWMPTQNPTQLQILSILTILVYVVSGSICTVYDGFTIANKLKLQSLVIVMCGIINVVVVLVLLKKTTLGVYAIAGVSSVIAIVRDLAFSLPMATRHLKLKWYTFYPNLLVNITTFVIMVVVVYPVRLFFTIDTWPELVLFSLISSMICISINFIFVLSKGERTYLFNMLLVLFKGKML